MAKEFLLRAWKYVQNKSNIKKILKIVILVYCALYAFRFIQLNFIGHQRFKANTLPYCLLIGTEGFLYNKEFLDEVTVYARYVDLNGDFKKEFIFQWSNFAYADIYSVGKDNSFTCIGSVKSWDLPPLYIPRWTIWGYPVIRDEDGQKLKWNGKEYDDEQTQKKFL